jgi:SAM-dependent methyltransferase
MATARTAQAVTYGESFFAAQAPDSLRGAQQVVPEVMALLSPASVVDVGCGVGTWLSVFRDCGVADFLGIDGSYVDARQLKVASQCFVARDLTGAIDLNRRFDLAVSLEVAEHLPPEAAEGFVAQLVELSDLVLFSAAIPGQGGDHHVNERWQSYWRDLFSARGYDPVDCLRHRFWNDPKVPAYYRQNMILYAERRLLAESPRLRAEADRAALIPLDLVHPLVAEAMLRRQPNLKALLRALPGSLRKSLLWHLGVRLKPAGDARPENN